MAARGPKAGEVRPPALFRTLNRPGGFPVRNPCAAASQQGAAAGGAGQSDDDEFVASAPPAVAAALEGLEAKLRSCMNLYKRLANTDDDDAILGLLANKARGLGCAGPNRVPRLGWWCWCGCRARAG